MEAQADPVMKFAVYVVKINEEEGLKGKTAE